MNIKDLAKTDLNLLISLQVLLEEKNVSRAAERLHITQPAMSKTLSRLRQLFDDPLFTRSSHGMQPSPRAQELSADLEGILAQITQLVTQSAFDPATFTGEVTLALSEYIGVALLPQLMPQLQAQAPLLNVRIITRIENQLEQLALGKLDFAIHIEKAHYGDEFRVRRVGTSPLTLLTRDAHPLNHGKLSWNRIAGFPLIRLYVSDLEQLEIQRDVSRLTHLFASQRGSLEISHLLTALEVLRNSDYAMLSPAYILQNDGATRGITASPIPNSSDYNIDYSLVAHSRTANSALHNWLWEQITCTIRGLRTPLPRKMRQRMAAQSSKPIQQR